jgi:hypothetical protein
MTILYKIARVPAGQTGCGSGTEHALGQTELLGEIPSVGKPIDQTQLTFNGRQ